MAKPKRNLSRESKQYGTVPDDPTKARPRTPPVSSNVGVGVTGGDGKGLKSGVGKNMKRG